jgi:hypothetical protein
VRATPARRVAWRQEESGGAGGERAGREEAASASRSTPVGVPFAAVGGSGPHPSVWTVWTDGSRRQNQGCFYKKTP